MDILGESKISKEKMIAYVESKKTAHPLAIALIPIFWDAAIKNGIKFEILYFQACKETGWFNYKGVLRPNFCNTCGLKVTKGGGDQDPGAHKRFEYWEDGIQAHADHLALYAGAKGFPKYSPDCASHPNSNCKANGTTKDPRHFTYLLGKCPTVESLGGNWAPSPSYGTDIVKMCNECIKFKVVDEKDNKIAELIEENKDIKMQLAVLNAQMDNQQREFDYKLDRVSEIIDDLIEVLNSLK